MTDMIQKLTQNPVFLKVKYIDFVICRKVFQNNLLYIVQIMVAIKYSSSNYNGDRNSEMHFAEFNQSFA